MIEFLLLLVLLFAGSNAPPPTVRLEVSKDHKQTWWVVELGSSLCDKATRVDVLVDGKCAAVRVARPYRFRLSGKNWKVGTHHRVCVRYRDAEDKEIKCEDVVISQ